MADYSYLENSAKGGPVNSPVHYNSHPSGVECIEIVEHMNFNLGNAVKYIWRADLKGDAVEDLEKAEWYIRRERERRIAIAEVAQEKRASEERDRRARLDAIEKSGPVAALNKASKDL